jgi:hypothetical protein
MSFFVGALASCAAQLLKMMIHGIHHLVEHHLIEQDHWWYLITPMIGITLAGLFVKYIVKDDISHGITKILYAISQRKSIIKLHNTWTCNNRQRLCDWRQHLVDGGYCPRQQGCTEKEHLGNEAQSGIQ